MNYPTPHPTNPPKKPFGDHLGIGIPIPIHHFVSGMFKQPIQTTSVQNELLFFSVQQTFISSLALIGCKLLGKGGAKIHVDNGRFVFCFFFGFRFRGHRHRWTHGTRNLWTSNLRNNRTAQAWKTHFCPTAMNKGKVTRGFKTCGKTWRKHLLTFQSWCLSFSQKKLWEVMISYIYIYIKYHEIWLIYSWNHNTRSTTVADLIKLSFCCSYKTLQRFTLGATLQHPLWRKVSDLENLEKKRKTTLWGMRFGRQRSYDLMFM